MNDYQFGNFVCKLREEKGLTQKNIADLLGVTPAAVSKWENGSSKPRVEVLFALAKILDVRPEELLAGKFLEEEPIRAETASCINERYEYLSRIESYAASRVKLKRLLSATIDMITAAAFAWLTTLALHEFTISASIETGTQAMICILWAMLSFLLVLGSHDFLGFGTSLGKRVMGLQILDKATGKEASQKQKFLRNLVTAATVLLSAVFLAVDATVILIRGQSIGDSAAHTVVVEKGRRSNQDIRTYEPPSGLSKKFIIGLFSGVAAIVITAIGLIALYFIKFDSDEVITADIANYEEDRSTYCNAAAFLPDLNSLTEYTDLRYSHKTRIYSQFMGFASEGLTLFVQYDASIYEIKKAELLSATAFLDAPVISSNGDYVLPAAEFVYKTYQTKVVPDPEYIDFCACKSFGLIGFDDENKSIVYAYHYSFDLDYIVDESQDPETGMYAFMDDVFAWKDDIAAALNKQ